MKEEDIAQCMYATINVFQKLSASLANLSRQNMPLYNDALT